FESYFGFVGFCFVDLVLNLHNFLIILAEPGQTVLLPCGLYSRNPVLVAEWSRTDLGSDYVLLYRDEQIDPSNQHPSFMNRVDLKDRNMEDGDVSVVLKDVGTEDKGTYECRVAVKLYWMLVISGPLNITITAEPGENVTLPCRTKNNQPAIIVEWIRDDLGEEEFVALYRDGRFDLDGQHSLYQNRVDLQDREMKDGDVSLVLKNVTTNDTGTYECRVIQRRNKRRKRSNIKGVSGNNATLPCRTPNNRPAIVVEWIRNETGEVKHVALYRGDRFDLDGQDSLYRNRVDLLDREMKNGDISLVLKNVTTDHTGTYECRDGGSSAGLIAGIIVGIIVVLALVGGFLLYRKHRQSVREQNPPARETERDPMNTENGL
uniref:Ig-like domain-containing protein n=1 Tax=Cyprinodon variegatus TaxID=28743 RepID=A0A3Q2FJD4_CYPVA